MIDPANIPSTIYVASPYSKRIVRVRPSGTVKVWKRSGEWRVPVKFGLYEHSSIGTHDTAQLDPRCAFYTVAEAREAFPRFQVQNGI